MPNFNQYFLLADHIKLSLLERQRAVYSTSGSTLQDGYIFRSLESLKEGIEKVNDEQLRLKNSGDLGASQTIQEMGNSLQAQYDDFMTQFRGLTSIRNISPPSPVIDTMVSGQAAKFPQRSQMRLSTSSLKTSIRSNLVSPNSIKTVRFSDSTIPASSTIFSPYRDDPGSKDNSHLDNQQLLSYNSQVMTHQDEALEQLSKSLERQRELSIQIGGDLNEQVEMLDGIDRSVDRHQTRLKKTMKQLETVAKNVKNNTQLRVIAVLLLILIVLIMTLYY